ncbi:unnamed protein product [Cuscuta epithymum]|uniref:Uncharacterized protein n=1 Tax=Cuscuta epithymum TaxID=186058 RepID=A0AAV0DW89_9ASTE|nr:unnamed protein product [Cuscuta epithymum]
MAGFFTVLNFVLFLLSLGRLLVKIWRSPKPKSLIEVQLSALSENFIDDLRELVEKYSGREDFSNYGRELVKLQTEYYRKVTEVLPLDNKSISNAIMSTVHMWHE